MFILCAYFSFTLRAAASMKSADGAHFDVFKALFREDGFINENN